MINVPRSVRRLVPLTRAASIRAPICRAVSSSIMPRSAPFRASNSGEKRATWSAVAAAAALTSVGTGIALTKDAETPQDDPAVAPSFRSAFQRVLPAVCKIAAVGSSSPSWFGRSAGPSVTHAAASGFVIDPDGIVMTNHHVLEGIQRVFGSKFKVLFEDGRVYEAEPIASDEVADIGLLRILPRFPGEKFTPVAIGSSSSMHPGDFVGAVGSPFGGRISASTGILSARYYAVDDLMLTQARPSASPMEILQFDADIVSGNSGGPVINALGEVVGVATMAKASVGGMSVHLGVTIDYAWAIAEQLRRAGRVSRPALGMTVAAVDRLEWQSIAEHIVTTLHRYQPKLANNIDVNLPDDVNSGLFVNDVMEGGAAEEAGLQPGDLIIRVNGNPAITTGDMYAALGPVYDSTRTFKVEVYRTNLAHGMHALQGKSSTEKSQAKDVGSRVTLHVKPKPAASVRAR